MGQISVAVLLAFAAAHARADATQDVGLTIEPGTATSADTYRAAPLAPADSSNAPAASANTGPQAAPAAPAVQFNPEFLVGSGAARMDISRFDKGNLALPGHYRATLYVNGIWIGAAEVDLREVDGNHANVQPTFNRDLLARAGVDLTRLSDAARVRLDAATGGGGTAFLPDLIPQASATFDVGEQRLDLSVPQAAMSRNARGWVDPQFWDDGTTASQLQYNANVYNTDGHGRSNTQGYLGLNAGLNVGAWRFRYSGNVTANSGSGTHVQSLQTYLQRSFEPIKSQLTLGDSYTDGSIFDSFGVRGVRLATDDRMYPESQRGYAPTVRGIASTNAKVEVRQSGNIIYTTTVTPGPFQIDDLYPTGYGGDLQVIVTEADGSQHTYLLPYASPVNALREGRWRYEVAAGQYRNTFMRSQPFVFEASVQHGIKNFVTLYGGTVLAEDYLSGAVGASFDTPIGAFAADLTQASTTLKNLGNRSGQSLRISYSRVFAPTDTSLTLAAYRYSTSGFLSVQDAMNLGDFARRGIASSSIGIQKGRLQLTVNQNLKEWGSVYFSGYTQNYWNRAGRDTTFQVGYNTNFRRVGVGVSAAREFDVDSARWDNRVMLSLSIPLDIGSKIANTTTSWVHDSRANTNQIQETFTGAAGTDNRFSYGVTAGYTDGPGNGTSINANAGYLSPVTQMRMNAGYANGYTQMGAGLTGTVVAYQGGLMFSPQTGDTLAVIEAKDAVGARVASAPGVRIDPHGLALVAGVQPYSQNRVEIDTAGLPLGIQLKSTEQQFAPTAGAVVRVKFDTQDRGRAVVLRLRRPNGEAAPFGADVLNEKGDNVGTVSQGSRAMFYAQGNNGELAVKWGESAKQTCKVRYALPAVEKDKPAATTFVDAVCE